MLQIISIILIIIGGIFVFGSSLIVKKFNIAEKMICNFDKELSEEELIEYKNNKALVNVKMLGLLIALPGIIIMLLFY